MNLAPLPIQKFFGNDGKPLVSGRLFTYAAGTSTKVATYVDSDGTPSNTNPIVFDFRGECRIWINPQLAYKFILAPPGVDDPPTNPIWTVDNITAGPAPFDLSATDTGPTNSIQLAIPLLASPEAFTRVVFRMNHTNTGAVTIAINGGSALALISQASAALVAGDLKLGGIYSAIFDGANWQLQDLSQGILPVWTQKHTFTKVGTLADPTMLLSSTLPLIMLDESDQADRDWVFEATGGLLAFTLSNDAHNITDDFFIVQASGTAITSVSFPKAATRAHRVGTTGGPTNFNSINLTLAAASQHGSQLITSTVNFAPLIAWNQATAGDNLFVVFETEGAGAATDRGTITYNRGAGLTAYNTTSDGRRKKNIENSLDAGLIIDRIKVRQFDWKDSGNHVDYWFVAQELHAVAPVAVTKGDDDDEDIKQAWSIDPSKLVPLLVKEIQSLRARMALIEGKKA